MSDVPLPPLAQAHRMVSRWGMWVALGLTTILVPILYQFGVLDITNVNQLGRYTAIALVALGLDLVWGYTGILSLCQMLFFTLGGYCMGMYLCMHGPLDGEGIPRALYVVSSAVGGMDLPWFWVPFSSGIAGIAAVLIVPGLVAFVFGWLAFRSRVRGVYFSIITQALTYIGYNVFCLNKIKLCGTNGLTNFDTMFGLTINEPNVRVGLFVASMLVLTAAFALSKLLVSTRTGRVLVAVRDSEMRLRFAGYQPIAYKSMIFTVGAILAAIGGALYVPQNGIITPSRMQPGESILIVVMVALGGRGTLSGAIIGSLIVSYLYSYLTSTVPKLWPFALGGLFVAVTLFFPGGIVGTWRALGAYLGRPKSNSSDNNSIPADVETAS